MNHYYYHNASVCGCENPREKFADGSFYSLFIGLGGQYPDVPMDQALEIAQEICGRCFVNGFTILTGTGANRCSSTVMEESMYIMAINATEEQVFRAASALLRELSPDEILLERNRTQYLYLSD